MEKIYLYHGVSVGDVVRIYNQTHTIIITKVYGNSVEYADCNNGDTCQITWGHVMSKDTLRSVYNYSYTQDKEKEYLLTEKKKTNQFQINWFVFSSY